VYGGIIIQDSSYQYGEIGDDNSNFTVLYVWSIKLIQPC
jgi:hypothetical protein